MNSDFNLSKDVINKLKEFPEYKSRFKTYKFPFYQHLNEKEKALLDELIPNEDLRERYKRYGLCDECGQVNTNMIVHIGWCQLCNSKHLQEIDALYKKFLFTQLNELNAISCDE